jgi:TRAP-type mannitol/chloroaromatic compound transport system permease small subunit
MVTGAHVRIDVFAERWSLRTKAWVELAGIALFLAPFAVFVLMHAIPFSERSYRLREVSASPGGLGARWIIKSFIVAGFALILAAAAARTLRILDYLFRHRAG